MVCYPPAVKVVRGAVALCSLVLTTAVVAAAHEAAFRFALAKLLVDQGAYNEAGRHFDRAIAAAPDDPFLRVEVADFLLSAERAADALEQLRVARELAPGNPEVAKAYGLLQLQAAREHEPAFAEARLAFEQLREQTPGDLEVMSTLGRIYLSEQRFADAAEVFREALGYWPRSRGTHGSLIDALLRAGDPVGAETAIDDFLVVEPTSIRARLTLADLRRQRGDAEGARAALVSTPRASIGDAELYRRLAFELYEEGAFEAALYWLDRSLATADADADPQTLYLRALLLTAADRVEEARAELEALVADEPRRLDALELLVRIHLQEEGWERAIELLEPRLDGELEPRHGELALLLAEALVGDERRAEALDWLARAAAIDGVRPQALARQAEVLLLEGREGEADEVLAELTTDGTIEGLLLAAEVCQRQEQFARSVPFLEEVIEQDGEALQARFWLGAAYERTQRYAEAEAQFQQFLALEPESAPALNYLGYMWADNGWNLEEALSLVQKAVALDPDNGAYVDSLGWAHFRLGNFEEAKDHLERAAVLVGDDAIVLEHLGDVYEVLGELENAQRSYRQALDLDGENADAVRVKLRRLDGR